MSQPRVSCVMITARRRHFVPRAVECFLAQTYPDRELVVYDSGDSIADLLPSGLTGPGRMIRYYAFHGTGERTIGELRNTANDVTNGELVANWDDDDWYHPERLAYQVEALGDADVGGLHSALFWDDQGEDGPRLWKYDGGRGSPLGSSLLYKRSFWRANPYLPLATGSDNFFWEDRNPRTVPGVLDNGRVYLIARMHESNSNRQTHDTVRRAWDHDPERVNLVWNVIDEPATVERVRNLVA